MVRKPVRKRPLPPKRVRGPRIDASRLAVAAVDRIKTLLQRTGHLDRLGPPVADSELSGRAELLREPLPPSYQAALTLTSAIGAPERLLTAAQMRAALEGLIDEGADDTRLVPFCATTGMLVCFDRNIRDASREIGVVEYSGGTVRFAAASFGEWLDQIADEREEALASAARIPASLRALLVDLGFTFEDPIVGRLETGDTDAIESLLGPECTSEVRGSVNRLFDSSGKASLTLNLDEFTLAVAVRTGIYVFEAPDVFRWLRTFRDQDFFRDTAPRKDPDSMRDLRAAPREPLLVQRGVVDVRCLGAQRLVFRAASGVSPDDFFVLGRTTSMRGASFILHVVDSKVVDVREVPDPLVDIYVTVDGTAWGLSHEGKAIRFAGGTGRAFPLQRPTPGRTAWYGIGAGGDRVLVWGAGALLEFDGVKFASFVPDAELDPSESVLCLTAGRQQLSMLVTSDEMGAVARFDGRRWAEIDQDHLIEAPLLDLDVWSGTSLLLTRDGRVLSFDESGAPSSVPWDRGADAFNFEGSVPRPLYGLRGFDGGTVLASEGGIIVLGNGEPTFYGSEAAHQPARLSRVGGVSFRTGASDPERGARSARGGERDLVSEAGLVAMIGPHLWTWRAGALTVVDTRSV